MTVEETATGHPSDVSGTSPEIWRTGGRLTRWKERIKVFMPLRYLKRSVEPARLDRHEREL